MAPPVQEPRTIPGVPNGVPAPGPSPETSTLLEQLRDVELPDPVSWWPPAPGWWVLAAAALITLSLLARALNRRRRQNLYKKEARRLLAEIHSEWKSAGDVRAFAASAQQLVRRVVIHHAGRDGVAGSTGSAFIEAANRLSTSPISTQSGTLLTEFGYRPDAEVDRSVDIDAIEAEIAAWLTGLSRSGRV